MSSSPGNADLLERIQDLEQDNARLRQELTSSRKISAILGQISHAFNASRNLPDLFTVIHQILIEHLGAANFAVALIDREQDRLYWPYLVDEVEDRYPAIEHISDPKTSSPTLEVIRSGKPLCLEKSAVIQKMGEGEYENLVGQIAEIWLCVPLIVKEKSLGAILMQDYHDPRRFSTEDIQILVYVSEHIAMALERKLHEDAMQRQKQVETIIYRISHAVSTATGLLELFGIIHQVLKDFIGAENFSIGLIDAKKDELHFPYDVDEKEDDPIVIRNISNLEISTPTLEVIRSGTPCLMKKAEFMEKLTKGEYGAIVGQIPEVWLCVPLKVKDKTLGAIVTQDYVNPNHYSEEDVGILVSVSAHIALALERKINEDLVRESEKMNAVLFRISNTVSTTGDIDALFRSIHDILTEHIDATNFYIALVNENVLRFAYFKDEFESHPPKDLDICNLDLQSPTLEVIRTGKPVFTSAKKANSVTIPHWGHKSAVWLGVPLKTMDQVIGAMVVQDYQNPYHYSEKDVRFMMTVSEQVALSIERGMYVEALKNAQEKALAATAAKSECLASMSHEIRTPMNGVIAAADLALVEPLDPKVKRYLDIIQSSGHSLLSIINDILDLSKIEAGKLELESASFKIDAVMDKVVAIFLGKAAEKQVELLLDIEFGIPLCVIGDALRLQQILTNLVGNALKFTDSGGMITMGLSRFCETDFGKTSGDDKRMRYNFFVKDTGKGIKPEFLENLFMPFVQEEISTTRKFGGTGLGLSISKQLVELMGGRIWAESSPGKGTTFFFTIMLPCPVQDPDNRYDIPDDLQNCRVLLVDDTPASLAVIAKMTTSLGFKGDIAHTGQEALTLLDRQQAGGIPYDLIVMDWDMPKTDVGQISQHLRRDLQVNAPLILFATFGKDVEKRHLKPAGISRFLTKPVTSDALYKAILEVFGKSKPLAVKPPSGICHDTGFYRRQLCSYKILLAEDNLTNQEIAKAVLKRAGISPGIANNGREAVELACSGEFHLILMDIQMPEMNGYEATCLIRRDPRFADLPIIAMTAHAMRGDAEKCIAAGMNDYVSKPISQAVLFETLLKHLQRTPKPDDCEDAPKPSEGVLGSQLEPRN